MESDSFTHEFESRLSDYFSTRAKALENIRQSIKGEENKFDLYLLNSTALSTFNTIESGLVDAKKLSSSPLGEIAYMENENEIKWIPPHSHEDVEKTIEDTFYRLKWKEVFGLNLTDVFNLPYDVWKRLTKRLTTLLNNKETTFHNDLMIQLLTELNQKMSILVGQVMAPMDKKDKRK